MRRPWSITLIYAVLAAALVFTGCGKNNDLQTLNSNNENNENSENNSNNSNNNTTGLLADGEICSEDAQCETNNCRRGMCAPGTCSDSEMNGNETDVDCGGVACPRCAVDEACLRDADCQSAICEDGTCVAARCDDGDRNGLESDVDCGGQFCDLCEDGSRCNDNPDCVSGVCEDNVCVNPTCDDTTTNANETDEDCGGPDCEPCSTGLACEEATDCFTGVCTDGTCSAPSCEDGVLNGEETDADCGGPCDPCAEGLVCARDTDCVSGVCDPDALTCSGAACDDGTLNGDETDVDCGGSVCAPCDPRDACLANTDCVSGICDMTEGECTEPTCGDFIKNGDETDIDCGGSKCGGCADTRACALATDCISLVCQGMVCQQSGCSDGQMNGDETDVDCGGSCNKCADALSCGVDDDCLSGRCMSGSCRAPSCSDGRKNGNETDVDCGGDCTEACADDLNCQFDSDCISSVCDAGSCSAPTCMDRATNGNETDLNCGGTDCPACVVGNTCDQDEDCDTMICDGGQFGPICAVCQDGRNQTVNKSCGYAGRGQVEQTCTGGVWVDTGCLDVYYRSCAEILEDDPTTPNGVYDIDPDGPATLYDEFSVFCDMMTDGGGWTEITACVAKQSLNAVVEFSDPAESSKGGPDCSHETQDEGDDAHTYYMTFDWPAGFREFYLQGYEIRANGLVDLDNSIEHTSDLGFLQADWNVAYGNNRGDVSFGAAGQVGPITSFTRQPGIGNTTCSDCVISWPTTMDIYDVNQMSTKFRIGWGEQGPESEGWNMWWSGAIMIRDE